MASASFSSRSFLSFFFFDSPDASFFAALSLAFCALALASFFAASAASALALVACLRKQPSLEMANCWPSAWFASFFVTPATASSLAAAAASLPARAPTAPTSRASLYVVLKTEESPRT